MEKAGLEWDLDATVFYGDPLARTVVPNPFALANRASSGGTPVLVIYPDSSSNHPVPPAEEGSTIFAADDFALVFPPSNPSGRR